ncbi:hypothetical protein SAMN02583745_01559 [Thorsellia anophelis DSM 18579]|uniref:Transposase n=1 Tax=Thorsellia anophelis DSM 18579 TaxID=1123402 RepID=A0A1I0CCT4_9GAMM|nr:hypothetical protein SAMN02583745_01559 [Thorsellia anophelis DSM 18579]
MLFFVDGLFLHLRMNGTLYTFPNNREGFKAMFDFALLSKDIHTLINN